MSVIPKKFILQCKKTSTLLELLKQPNENKLAEVWYYRAYAFGELGKHKEAVEANATAIKLYSTTNNIETKEIEAWYNKG